MKKLLISFLVISMHAFAIDEALFLLAKSEGTTIYFTCIATPPIDPAQQAACATLHTTYEVTLGGLNAPFPLTAPIPNLSPYKWSPYDVCRYETSQMVFGDLGVQPYCPTLPV